jgi:hypothetical protein
MPVQLDDEVIGHAPLFAVTFNGFSQNSHPIADIQNPARLSGHDIGKPFHVGHLVAGHDFVSQQSEQEFPFPQLKLRESVFPCVSIESDIKPSFDSRIPKGTRIVDHEEVGGRYRGGSKDTPAGAPQLF